MHLKGLSVLLFVNTSLVYFAFRLRYNSQLFLSMRIYEKKLQMNCYDSMSIFTPALSAKGLFISQLYHIKAGILLNHSTCYYCLLI